jgi:hypothetical protein
MPQRTNKYPPKTLVRLQPVQVFAATFVDGDSYSDTRFVVKIGNNVHFLHPEGVDAKIRQPAGWLKEAVLKEAKSVSQLIDQESEEIPDSEMEELPSGAMS